MVVTKFNAVVAPLMSFDSKGSLQFREAMYVSYAIEGLYKDRPYRGLKHLIAKKPLNLSYIYERTDTSKGGIPKCITREKEPNSRLRNSIAVVERERQTKLTHIHM